ncbi:MAG: anion permease [Deltaproteobacteria bacterium]|nr:anion permease [Deltaproteobacteria bacterium]
MLIAILVLASLALAWANGANDNFKASATVYGAGAMNYAGARRLATLAQLAGSAASVVVAGSLLAAFGGKGLVPATVVGDPRFLAAVALGAAATVLLATRVGLPISTTHALVGGLAGAGLAIAPTGLAWRALGDGYFLPLLVSPLLAASAAGLLYPLARTVRQQLGITATTCVCLGSPPQPVSLTAEGGLVLRRTGLPLTVAEEEACRLVYDGRLFGIAMQSLVDRLHQASAFALGFARGLNDTPKVLALLVAANWSGVDPRVSLTVVAGAMAAGGWLRARRVAETLAHRITSLSHGQGLLANGIASTLVIGASLLGSPVSTTHVSTGAIFGIGAWSEATDWRMATGIVAAWVGTLPCAALLAGAAAWSLGA